MEKLDLQRVREGDLKYLRKLDARGLSPAVGEDAEAFASRLEKLQTSLAEFETKLSQKGQVDWEGVLCAEKNRIPRSGFEASLTLTDELYGFQCDWVPGFFCNPRFSWLFGGCTYSFPPEFFALFIISAKLRKAKKFLCYDREEILAHELCHVARSGLGAVEFEELIAYQTAKSGFRRVWGGIMHSQWDSLIFLLACLFLVAAQIFLPLLSLPFASWLGWAVFGAVVLFYILRQANSYRIYKKALANVAAVYQGDERIARKVVFHATDKEIRQLARTKDARRLLDDWQSELRWKIALDR